MIVGYEVALLKLYYNIPVSNDKMSFYSFVQHVDVFFYHLRKKVKENFEVLSTNSTFQLRVSTMYDACVKKNKFTVNIKQDIAKVMMGDGIRYNTHWALVADVLFLIFIREKKH